MCDDPIDNTSSSSLEEERRFDNKIDQRILSLITIANENEHIDSHLRNYTSESFTNILK